MKTITIRLPETLVADIEEEARKRNVSKSDVVRQRLQAAQSKKGGFEAIADLAGSVEDDLPADLSANTKRYLAAWGYGRKRSR